MLFQVAVFLQPLLPEQYQIARVCRSVAELQPQMNMHHAHFPKHDVIVEVKPTIKPYNKHQDDTHHQCLFCTVYSHLLSDLNSEIVAVFDRRLVRLIAFQKAFKHIFFQLQRLFLSPQGRAPPLLA